MTANAVTTTATTDRLRGRCQRSRNLTSGDRTKLRRTASAIGISTSRATKRNVAISAVNKTVVAALPDGQGTCALNAFKKAPYLLLKRVSGYGSERAPQWCCFRWSKHSAGRGSGADLHRSGTTYRTC